MDRRQAACRGCLLGLAVGDAMGYTVDKKTWDEICRDYGPNGLLGYDLVNGSAEITSYTQMAAFVSNGLLLGIYRGRQSVYCHEPAGMGEEPAVPGRDGKDLLLACPGAADAPAAVHGYPDAGRAEPGDIRHAGSTGAAVHHPRRADGSGSGGTDV